MSDMCVLTNFSLSAREPTCELPAHWSSESWNVGGCARQSFNMWPRVLARPFTAYGIRVDDADFVSPVAQPARILRVGAIRDAEAQDVLIDVARLDPPRLRQRIDAIEVRRHGEGLVLEGDRLRVHDVQIGEEAMKRRQQIVVLVRLVRLIGLRGPQASERVSVNDDVVVSFDVERFELLRVAGAPFVSFGPKSKAAP